MGGIFNINSPFFKVMSKVFDIFVLSLIWTVCCIPVITIGPATTALYYSVVKSIRKDRSYPVKEFFKSFKQNFKTGAITSTVLTLLSLLLTLNLSYAKAMQSSFGNFLWYLYLVLLILVFVISMYVYPVLSRFTVTFRNLLKLSLFFSIRHFLTTIVSILIVAAGVFVVLISALIGLVFVPGVCALLSSFMMEGVLKRYTPDAKPEEGDMVDEWYNE